jgi:hypothetical protein
MGITLSTVLHRHSLANSQHHTLFSKLNIASVAIKLVAKQKGKHSAEFRKVQCWKDKGLFPNIAYVIRKRLTPIYTIVKLVRLKNNLFFSADEKKDGLPLEEIIYAVAESKRKRRQGKI